MSVLAILGLLAAAITTASLPIEPAVAASPAGYTVTAAITAPNVGPGTASVAVDSSRHRIYSLDGDDNVYVFDSSLDTFVTRVPVVGPTAVAVDTVTNTIYAVGETSDGLGQLSVINGVTDTVTQVIAIPTLPEDVLVDPTTNLVWVLSGRYEVDGALTKVNGATNTVVSTSPTGNWPSGFAIDPVAHTVWVSNSSSGGDNYGYEQPTVMEFSESSNTLLRAYPFADLTSPADVTLDSTDNSFFVTNNDDQVIKIDQATGAVLDTITLEGTTDQQVSGPTSGMLFDPAANTLYVANSYSNNFTNTLGTITVVNAATDVEVGPVPTGTTTNSLALDPATDEVYFGGVDEIGELTGPAAGLPFPSPASSEPLASLTFINGASLGLGVVVTGWAVEPDAPNAGLTVTLTVDGSVTISTIANQPDPGSVSADRGAGDLHGFHAGAGVTAGSHTACVTINGVGRAGAELSLGCHTIQVPPASPVTMLGAITAARGVGGEISFSGWAARSDNTTAVVPLTLQFAGKSTSFVTGLADPDGPVFNAGPDQGFAQSFAAPAGWQTFCVLATPTVGPAVQLGCSEVDVSAGFVSLPTPMTFPLLHQASAPTAAEFAVATAGSAAASVSSADLGRLILSSQRDLRVAVR
jgi:DNA-binding beta-propeller fold protein YncE